MTDIARVLLVAATTATPAAAAQFRYGNPPEDLAAWEWTAWLLGEWEGTAERDGDSVPYRQSFTLSPDRRYLLTHNERGVGADAYRGFGVFSYYPATGEAYGQWFGMNHDTNDGWARRDGERMVWTIRRLGLRITRTRTRTGPDSYVVDNEILAPDGSVTHSRETMQRVRAGGDTVDVGAGPAEVALAMPRAIDYADWDGFIGLFAEDAVMFFPFSDARAVGRDAIASVMRPIFERNRERLPGPIFGFEPVDVVVTPAGSDGAVVSWLMRREGSLQRRSAVLRRDEGTWRIVLVHADNRPVDAAG